MTEINWASDLDLVREVKYATHIHFLFCALRNSWKYFEPSADVFEDL